MHNIFLLVLVKSFEAGVHFSLEQLAYKVDPTVAAMLVYICKKMVEGCWVLSGRLVAQRPFNFDQTCSWKMEKHSFIAIGETMII